MVCFYESNLSSTPTDPSLEDPEKVQVLKQAVSYTLKAKVGNLAVAILDLTLRGG